ncbi:hypothetical protein MBAV_006435 [Candidatus Magnetobacterium bavaricum]|uniref:Uncharacterized protein n=1 Tax=Candidatus Magnetobacterium bavaricum TaxID=29290 RepID=A0A0F3GHF9_9BACT|nr:hypothetical protein MBAV_006432 [Candidatus Magnetobacterium bavaricum]KJU81375.1 hypothetical protein MBAV_006435 [Candidatus Magnetobacterium bavaricum]
MAHISGYVFVSNPSATPTNDTCASVSAIIEYRRMTRYVPISGAITAMTTPAANARRINPNSNISNKRAPLYPNSFERRSASGNSGPGSSFLPGAMSSCPRTSLMPG